MLLLLLLLFNIKFQQFLVARLVLIGLLYTGRQVVRSGAMNKRTGPRWEVGFMNLHDTECLQLYDPGGDHRRRTVAAMLASACMFA